MKKLFLVFVLALSLFTVVNGYTVTVTNVKNNGFEGETLLYNLTVYNDLSKTDTITFFDLTSRNNYVISYSTNRLILKPGENKTVQISITSTVQTPLEIEVPITIYLTNSDNLNKEVKLRTLFKKRLNPKPEIKTVFLNELIDPRLNNSVTIVLYNPSDTIIRSTLRYEIFKNNDLLKQNNFTVYLDPYINTKITLPLELNYHQEPGDYSLRITAFNNEFANPPEIVNFKVLGFSEFNVEAMVDNKIVFKTVKIIVSNNGTSQDSTMIPVKINLLDLLLKYYSSHDYNFTNGNLVFSLTIPPGESEVITFKITYLPLILSPFLLVSGWLGYKYYSAKLRVDRSVKLVERGESSSRFKVSITIRNVTESKLKKVKVRESVIPFVNRIGSYGTLHPKLIGTDSNRSLVWDLNDLDPKNEVVLTYEFETSIGILDKIVLPPTKVSCRFKGKKLEYYSSSLII